MVMNMLIFFKKEVIFTGLMSTLCLVLVVLWYLYGYIDVLEQFSVAFQYILGTLPYCKISDHVIVFLYDCFGSDAACTQQSN